MKGYVFIVSAVCFAVFLCAQVSAAAYKDDMTGNTGDSVKQYQNLTEYSFSRMASYVPDSTALSFLSTGNPSAWATYRVNGASEVTAGIYSLSGTFSAYNQKDSTYYLGIFEENMQSGTRQQAFYSPSANAVYRDSAGSAQAYTDSVSYKFAQARTRPPDALIGYGVNFYYSADGKTFTRIASARHTGLKYSTASSLVSIFCYEEYTATVPAGAKYIRVEINDVTGLPHVDGGMIMKAPKAMTALASVTISGDSLVMGEPVEEAPKQEIVSSSSAADPYYEPEIEIKEKKAKSKAEKEESESQLYAQSEPVIKEEGKSVSSSKFEGTITSSGSSKSSQPKASSKSGEGASKSSEPPVSAQSGEERGESIIYEIRRENSGERFSGMVWGYIGVVTLLLFLALMLPRKK